MRPDDRAPARQRSQGGIPDGLLVGLLAFLLGLTLLVWTATGLAGLFAHGAWPTGVTFTRTPLAMRHLIADPQDIPGAWPDTAAGQLSGYGLFWGLFIGQLMILIVLTVFVVGTLARWKAVRARRRPNGPRAYASGAGTGPAARTSPEPVDHRRAHGREPRPDRSRNRPGATCTSRPRRCPPSRPRRRPQYPRGRPGTRRR